MKYFDYTYSISSNYIDLRVNHQLASQYTSRHSPHITPRVKAILDKIANTQGVIIDNNGAVNSSELIVADGNTLTIKSCELCEKELKRVAYNIVRKIHRHIQPVKANRLKLRKVR